MNKEVYTYDLIEFILNKKEKFYIKILFFVKFNTLKIIIQKILSFLILFKLLSKFNSLTTFQFLFTGEQTKNGITSTIRIRRTQFL